jgi:hypothetical protein
LTVSWVNLIDLIDFDIKRKQSRLVIELYLRSRTVFRVNAPAAHWAIANLLLSESLNSQGLAHLVKPSLLYLVILCLIGYIMGMKLQN